MTEMPDAAAWQQLGEMLRRHRIGLDRRYSGRGGLTAFTGERGINYRVAWDIENAKRDNYTRATRREIEIAYGLPVRAIDDFLAAAHAEEPPPISSAPSGAEITEGLTEEQKASVRAFAEFLRQQRDTNGGERKGA